MIETIIHENNIYPLIQAEGFAAQYAFPFAKKMLSGEGLDIGCGKEEWKFPGAQGIDLTYGDKWDAYNLPEKEYDYIFSSHCLEHLPDWVEALDHWSTRLKRGGIMFLYLPHYEQTYWRPWNNRKHLNILQPEYLHDYFVGRGYKNVLTTGYDLLHSFYAVAERDFP